MELVTKSAPESAAVRSAVDSMVMSTPASPAMRRASAAMSAAWYWYSGMAETKPDYKTCAAMIVIPVGLIVFRKPLDKVLRPMEPYRKKIPPIVLAGCGAAIPLLVANYLYSHGETQFPFMFKTYVYSTLLSYIVLRTPSGGRLPSGFPAQGGNI